MAGVKSGPFDPRRRLRCKKHFDRVFREPIRSADCFFTVLARKRSGNHPRLGMAISVRSAGGAVARNRVKRIVRESFRLNQQSLPAVDLVVMGRPGIGGCENADLRESLEKHWQRIRRRCEKSSRS
jgi:ribonuclease P protein component